MDRWNELIAGFVLGNLTPEEAESMAEILAENPQLAGNIARLRNTATVRSLCSAEWSTARSQDGSEGWADTALDLPELDSPSGLIDSRLLVPAAEHAPIQLLLPPSDGWASSKAERRGRKALHPATDRLTKQGAERFSWVESLCESLSNPVWWIAIAAVIAVGIDDFRVRRSLSMAQEEIAQLKALQPSGTAE